MIYFFPRASKPGTTYRNLFNNFDLFKEKGTLKLSCKGVSCLFHYQKNSYTVEALVSDQLGHPATRGNSHVKVTSLLVVSLWGVNCRFCSHLGCWGWKVTIFALIQVSLSTVP